MFKMIEKTLVLCIEHFDDNGYLNNIVPLEFFERNRRILQKSYGISDRFLREQQLRLYVVCWEKIKYIHSVGMEVRAVDVCSAFEYSGGPRINIHHEIYYPDADGLKIVAVTGTSVHAFVRIKDDQQIPFNPAHNNITREFIQRLEREKIM